MAIRSPAQRGAFLTPGELAGLGIVLALTACLAAPLLWAGTFFPDELSCLYESVRVLHGQVVYRDFFEFVGPLSLWLPVPVFALGGPSLLAARAIAGGLLLLIAGMLYTLARRLGAGAGAAILLGASVVPVLFRAFPAYYHHWLALAAGLCGLLAAQHALAGRSRAWVVAGACAAGALLTTQPHGLVWVTALGLGAALCVLTGDLAGRALPGVLWRLTLGAALPLAACGLYLALTGALGAAVEDLWRWPATHYMSRGGYNDVAFGTDVWNALNPFSADWINRPTYYAKAVHLIGLEALFVAMPLLALTGLCLGAMRRPTGEAPSVMPMLALAQAGYLLIGLKGRADVAHVAFYAAPALLYATVLADRTRRAIADPALAAARWAPLAALGLLALTGAGLTAQAMRQAPGIYLSRATPDSRVSDLETVRYIRLHTRPGDRIALLPSGGVGYFYGREAALRETSLLPPGLGYTTDAEWRAVFAEIVRERPALVIVGSLVDEPATRRQYLGWPLPGYRFETTLKEANPGGPAIFAHVYRTVGTP